MKLFRAKSNFHAYRSGENIIDPKRMVQVLEGQLFVVKDETNLPDPRQEYPGNRKPFFEEIVPSSLLVKQFSQVAKVREL